VGFYTLKSQAWRSLAAAVLLATTTMPTSSTTVTATADNTSQIMPRATKSLLLDVATAGARIIAVGERGHILLSDDQGQHWRQVVAPTRSLLTAVFFVDDKRGWAVGHDGVVLGTLDSGASWQKLRTEQLHDQSAPPLMDVWFADSQHGWAVGAYGTFLSTHDGGTSWDDNAARLPNPDELHLNAITGDASGALFVVGEQGKIFVSNNVLNNNEGESWQAVDSGYQGSLFGVMASADGNEIYAFGLRGSLLRSTDHGVTWSALNTNTDTNLNGGFINSERMVLVGVEGSIRVRRNGEEVFYAIDSGSRSGFSSVIALDHARLLVVGQGGAITVSPTTTDNSTITTNNKNTNRR